MDRLLQTVLNMSLTGAFVIAAICLARLPLKKAPKTVSYCLWAVAGLRLALPFSFESVFSLIPRNMPEITAPPRIFTVTLPPVGSPGWEEIYLYSNHSMLRTPIWSFFDTLAVIWLAGAAAMLLYGVVSYLLLRRGMRPAIRVEGNLFETDGIPSPFVLGFIKPKIYIPFGLSGQEREYIILHERTHIKRRDHMVKLAAYIILCLHWFNPLAWAAFLLMGVDMEMSCDERVLKAMGGAVRKEYSRSLLSLAANRRVINGSPLAFSEGGLKGRIKNVLNFRKPSRIIVTLAIAAAAVLGVGFALNRAGPGDHFTSMYETSRWYFLENASKLDRIAKPMYVALHDDGTASLAMAVTSSYIPPPCTYSIEGGEMTIYAAIKTDFDKGGFELEDGDIIAKFSVADDENTLVFIEAFVPLIRDIGARYIYRPAWMLFDDNKLRIYAENIPGIEVYQVINGQSSEWTVTDASEIAQFAEWAGNLILEKTIFSIDESPGDHRAEVAYLLRTSFGAYLFQYSKYSDSEHYILFGNDWYHVKNPSDPFPAAST